MLISRISFDDRFNPMTDAQVVVSPAPESVNKPAEVGQKRKREDEIESAIIASTLADAHVTASTSPKRRKIPLTPPRNQRSPKNSPQPLHAQQKRIEEVKQQILPSCSQKSEQVCVLFTSEGIYEGAAKDGLAHGEGTMKYSNGDIYTGNFHKGQKSVHGSYDFANGDHYYGLFSKDKMSGWGSYTFAANGKKYQGSFRDGEAVNKDEFERVKQLPKVDVAELFL